MTEGEISTIAIVNLSAFSRKFLFNCILFITIQRSHYLQLPSSSSLESLRRRDILQIQSKRINRQIKEQSWAATLSRVLMFCISGMPSPITYQFLTKITHTQYASRNTKEDLQTNLHEVDKLFGSSDNNEYSMIN